MMHKLEFLEVVSHEGRRYEKGDIVSVDDNFAAIACGHGWAKDVDGKLETGERSIHPRTLEVQPAKHAASIKKPGE